MDGTQFIVFFEDPFWVGLVDSRRDGRRFVSRTVFGAEPSNAELLAFMRDRFDRLLLSAAPVPDDSGAACAAVRESARGKRALRQAAREQSRGPGKAQAACHAAFEARAAAARSAASERRRSDAADRYALRREKKKEAKRGK